MRESAEQRSGRRRRCGRWSGFEIAAMVLGFVLFWPVGLAILFWILWNKQQGRTTALPQWTPAWARSWGMPGASEAGALARASGNSAFEEWKQGELQRLEEEHRRLAAAQKEFQGFLDQLKRAKDREEFDRFMAARGKPA
ncbi:MAG: DUF2852 domain-containing protein [Variibacter sp.]|nr:DUF2852 domain-containing protein [Variibacter sp.]